MMKEIDRDSARTQSRNATCVDRRAERDASPTRVAFNRRNQQQHPEIQPAIPSVAPIPGLVSRSGCNAQSEMPPATAPGLSGELIFRTIQSCKSIDLAWSRLSREGG